MGSRDKRESRREHIHLSPKNGRKIRVCFCINRLNPGGSERQVLLLAKYLPRDRFDVTIATLFEKGSWSEEARRRADHLFSAGRVAARDLPLSLKRLNEYLGAENFDIVHPFAWPVNSFVPIMAAKLETAIVGSVRATDMRWSGLRRLIIPRLELRALGNCHHIISNSIAGKALLLQKNIPDHKISVIENGIELNQLVPKRSRSEMKAEVGIDDGYLFGLVIARLEKIKGIDSLIDASTHPAISRTIRFAVAGSGPEHRRLAEKIRRTGAPVTLLGNRNDLPDLINAADFLCHPSFGESFPNAVAEAMALKRPVVASSVGDTARLVVPGETGVLYNCDTPGALQEALIRAVANRDKFSDWGKAAFRHVTSICSADRMIDNHVKIYELVSL